MAPARIYDGFDTIDESESVTTTSVKHYEPQLLKNVPSPCLSDPVDWSGSQLHTKDQFITVLTEGHKAEVDHALRYFKGQACDVEHISQDRFPLPTLRNKLASIAKEIHNGRGFAVLRGLEPEKYSHEDNMLVFSGIASHIAGLRGKQTDNGQIFAHIRDAKHLNVTQSDRRVKDSHKQVAFHNDIGGDILAMHVRNVAAFGGDHLLVSASRIYHELKLNRPDLARELLQPEWPLDLRDKEITHEIRPIFFSEEGRILSCCATIPLFGVPGGPTNPELPPLTERQKEAYNAVQALGWKHHIALKMQPGDMIFVNNLGILHGREEFVDTDACSRYLVRMWLKNEQLAWKLPTALKHRDFVVFSNESCTPNYNILDHSLDTEPWQDGDPSCSKCGGSGCSHCIRMP